MNEPFPTNLYPAVDEDDENAILKEIAEEWADEIYEELDDAYPNYVVSPAVRLPSRERWQRYLLRLIEAYPNDPEMARTELFMLLEREPDYVDQYKLGVYLPPMSRPWNALIRVPRIFREMQKDLRQLATRYLPEMTTPPTPTYWPEDGGSP